MVRAACVLSHAVISADSSHESCNSDKQLKWLYRRRRSLFIGERRAQGDLSSSSEFSFGVIQSCVASECNLSCVIDNKLLPHSTE